ncbi:YrhA family protein [Pedobacter sp. R20-19]|uniref:YrhA family protein n=1 Tax=Pedobacter sp. R20-19 TaxID=1270196 RepID=UPI00049333E6|nr:YrhA family protein [Pedobacter sp. R20-19]
MKKLENIISAIKEQHLKYGDQLQSPATTEEINDLESKIRQMFKVELAEAYKKILTQTNGIDNDGIVLYGTKTLPVEGYQNRFVYGLIEANEEWHDFVDYLFYAESEMYLFVQSLSDESFSYRSRERFEDVIFSTDDNELFFEIILKLALGENIEEEYSN